jgi:hypothetical protein
MKERPILMCGEMVRATLDGTKTQTRRILKFQPDPAWTEIAIEYQRVLRNRQAIDVATATYRAYPTGGTARWGICECPYGIPGDRLWVRETFRTIHDPATCIGEDRLDVDYKADGIVRIGDKIGTLKWRPAIHMPKYLSRLKLEITKVRVERVQDISEADAKAEGVPASKNVEMKDGSPCYRIPYQILWNQINGCDAWDKNPWVWVIVFRRL